MSQILELTDRLRSVSGWVAERERELVRSPGDFTVELELESLVRHQRELIAEFEEVACAAGIDVCRYVTFGRGTALARPVMKSAVEFQDLYSITHSSIVHGPKRRATVSPQDLMVSQFGFSHVLAGSIVFVLTLPNERILMDEVGTALDQAMRAVVSMCQVRTSADVEKIRREFGSSVVQKLHAWTLTNLEGDLGTRIEWRRGAVARESAIVQPQEFVKIAEVIQETGEETIDTLVVVGTLRGADEDPKRFHFRTDSGQELRGTYFDAISEPQHPALFRRYKATIIVKSVSKASKDEQDVSYFLDTLEPLETDQ